MWTKYESSIHLELAASGVGCLNELLLKQELLNMSLLGVRSVGGELRGLSATAVTLVSIANARNGGERERSLVNRSGIAVVGVDASQGRTARPDDLRDQDGALVLTRDKVSG